MKIIKILKWPIVFMLSQFILATILTLIFNTNHDINNENYVNDLAQFFIKYNYVIVLLLSAVFIPILLKEGNYSNWTLTTKQIIIDIILGSSIAIFYNSVIYLFHLTSFSSSNKIYSDLIATGILGPIMEELIFRGNVYSTLKEKHNSFSSIILTGIVFSLFHFNPIQMVYAFLINIVLIKFYDKDKTLSSPILIHSVANITTLFIVFILLNNNLIISYSLLFISVITIIMILKKYMYNN